MERGTVRCTLTMRTKKVNWNWKSIKKPPNNFWVTFKNPGQFSLLTTKKKFNSVVGGVVLTRSRRNKHLVPLASPPLSLFQLELRWCYILAVLCPNLILVSLLILARINISFRIRIILFIIAWGDVIKDWFFFLTNWLLGLIQIQRWHSLTLIETEVLAGRDSNTESELFPLRYWQISHILGKWKETGKQIIVTYP